VAVAPAGSFTTSTSVASEVEAEAGAAAAAAGSVAGALPNQPAPKVVINGQNSEGAPVEVAAPGAPAALQPTLSAVARFIGGLDAAFARARVRARLGALFGNLERGADGRAPSRRLGAWLSRWSPVINGLGSPALTLAAQLAQASLSAADQRAVAPAPRPPTGAEPTPSTSSIPADLDSVGKTTVIEISTSRLIVTSIALSTVAWTHAHRARRRRQGNRNMID
jgi:hypothetical protein